MYDRQCPVRVVYKLHWEQVTSHTEMTCNESDLLPMQLPGYQQPVADQSRYIHNLLKIPQTLTTNGASVDSVTAVMRLTWGGDLVTC